MDSIPFGGIRTNKNKNSNKQTFTKRERVRGVTDDKEVKSVNLVINTSGQRWRIRNQ